MPPHDVPQEPSRFPSPTQCDSDGLLAIGGRLAPDWLMDAYRHGIFPWPDSDDLPIYWWSPDPRAIIELDGLHVSRRLRRRMRSGRFQVSHNRAFRRVMQLCATTPDRRGSTWITPMMIQAYSQLHELGLAHSVEVWNDANLVGGVYGVSIGGAFAAESMFHLETDASKTALVVLVTHLRRQGFQLLDIQQLTPHTASMGATEVPRSEYLRRLRESVNLDVQFGPSTEPGPTS